MILLPLSKKISHNNNYNFYFIYYLNIVNNIDLTINLKIYKELNI